jgi:hypothetical protein
MFPGNGSNNGSSSASGSSPLFIDSRQNRFGRPSCPDTARTTEKHQLSNSPSDVARRFVAKGTCLSSRCPETALVYPPISRSLHSNGSTRYIIFSLNNFLHNHRPERKGSNYTVVITTSPLNNKYIVRREASGLQAGVWTLHILKQSEASH